MGGKVHISSKLGEGTVARVGVQVDVDFGSEVHSHGASLDSHFNFRFGDKLSSQIKNSASHMRDSGKTKSQICPYSLDDNDRQEKGSILSSSQSSASAGTVQKLV
mmetsp:Transcript_31060/g.47450  ORF Transcript_31060/g.47450 Transcript_31060/m.47450 type:complete len:105 (-) Transcript_31060:744-1058(-)